MATKRKPAKTKLSKNDILSSGFYKRAYRFQDNLLELGNSFIGEWLQDAESDGNFEEAVDWLLSEDAQKLIKSNEGVFAFDIISYALDKFLEGDEEEWEEDGGSCDENEDEVAEDDDDAEEDESSDDDEEIDIYDRARDWFNG